jgi:serine/threonine-protein kinase
VSDGAILGGKYRILRVIGQGGMGVVVEAVHVELDDRVAIKFLTPNAQTDPGVLSRFVREAKAVVRLRSQHVARVRDVGNLPGGDPFIVMDFLEGVELREMFTGPRLAPGALVDLVLQACEGLAEAHAHGIIHRDIKPSNLFVTRQVDGTPLLKVLDFGISKTSIDTVHLTHTNSWMGTPSYMSPEQMRSSREADARSDLWSLGVVLYEGLEGRLPFPAENLADLCVQVTADPFAPMTADVPPGLRAVVARCLDKEPARRYANVAALASALAPFALSKPQAQLFAERTRRLLSEAEQVALAAEEEAGPTILDRSLRDPSELGSAATWHGDSDGELTPAKPRRAAWKWALGAAAFALAVIVGFLAIHGSGSQPSPAPAPLATATPVDAALAPVVAVDAATIAVDVIDAGVVSVDAMPATVPAGAKPAGSDRRRTPPVVRGLRDPSSPPAAAVDAGAPAATGSDDPLTRRM